MRASSLSQHKRAIPIGGLVLLVAAILWLAFALGRAWTAADAVRADLRAVEMMLSGGAPSVDLEDGARLLCTLHADVEVLCKASRPFLWMTPYLGWVPWYGADIQTARLLLDMALDLSAAGNDVAGLLFPLLIRATDDAAGGQQALLAEVLAGLRSLRPQLIEALSTVREAQVSRKEIVTERLRPRTQSWVVRLDRYLPLLERAVVGALVLPEALGSEAPHTYLVLLQNEDELRATGGFISGVARVTVANGRLGVMSFEDSYAIDDFSQPYPNPPGPLLEYMLSEMWVFRDSNWSPDFPTSAQAAIDLYAISRTGGVDGVIALDQQAIQLLVDAIGPLHVEGAPKPVTGKNIIDLTRQAWGPGEDTAGDWWRHRKDFMGAALNAAARRLEQGMTQDDLPKLGRAVAKALDEKHLLVYLRDEEASTRLSEVGWDGAVRAAEGDYLYVVDANVGFNKVNALVQERLEYVVDLSNLEHPRAVLTVRHQHTLDRPDAVCEHRPRYGETYEEMMERCYWDYLRVYVAADSRLTNATPHEVPGEALLGGRPSPAEVRVGPHEQGHNVFATLFLLRPWETLETRFEYTLPRQLLRRTKEGVEYLLLVQKQPGTSAVPLDVRLLLPEDAALVYSDPQPTEARASELRYALPLLTDRTLGAMIRLK
jgi:hypothetical protein